MNMADDDAKGAQITSLRKELKFDDKTGRFFETDIDLDECIPDEEFCTVDEETGSKIRLTMAEKERIFLDSLQVCFYTEAALVFFSSLWSNINVALLFEHLISTFLNTT